MTAPDRLFESLLEAIADFNDRAREAECHYIPPQLQKARDSRLRAVADRVWALHLEHSWFATECRKAFDDYTETVYSLAMWALSQTPPHAVYLISPFQWFEPDQDPLPDERRARMLTALAGLADVCNPGKPIVPPPTATEYPNADAVSEGLWLFRHPSVFRPPSLNGTDELSASLLPAERAEAMLAEILGGFSDRFSAANHVRAEPTFRTATTLPMAQGALHQLLAAIHEQRPEASKALLESSVTAQSPRSRESAEAAGPAFTAEHEAVLAVWKSRAHRRLKVHEVATFQPCTAISPVPLRDKDTIGELLRDLASWHYLHRESRKSGYALTALGRKHLGFNAA